MVKKNSIILMGIFLICILSYYVEIKIDATQDKRFTITESTKFVLKNIDSPIKITLYKTKNQTADYKKLFNAAEELLEYYKKLNPLNIQYAIIDFDDNFKSDSIKNNVLDSFQQQGAKIEIIQEKNQLNKNVSIVIPTAFVQYKNTITTIDLTSSRKIYKLVDVINDQYIEDKEATKNEATALLEYKFTNTIYNFTKKNKPTIAYLVGNGEPLDLKVFDLIDIIKNNYNIAIFNLKKGFPNPANIQTLLIIKPTQPFTDLDKYKLDQFVTHGGNIIWAIDKLYAEYDSLKKTAGSYIAFDRNLHLEDLFFKYGVRINNNLVQDLNCSKIPIVTGFDENKSPIIQRLPWAYYPLLISNNNHPINKNIDKVLSLFPASIDTIPVANISKTILLTTDTTSRIISTPNLVSLQSIQTESDLLLFKNHYIPIAVLNEGKFNSLYEFRNNPQYEDSMIKQTGNHFIGKSNYFSKQIFISDADVFTNFIDKTTGPMEMGKLPFENYLFANRNFYLNSIEYISSDIPLYESRNKTYILRLLDKNKINENKLLYQIVFIIIPIILFIFLTLLIQFLKNNIYSKSY